VLPKECLRAFFCYAAFLIRDCMKVSFVIPAFNEEGYLGACLKVLVPLAQDPRYDIEIIVVNNASTDGTEAVARSFAGVRVVDEPRKGLSQARQTGFLAAQGELIANIDADTLVSASWLDKVLKEFSADPQLVALSGPFVYYDLSAAASLVVRMFYACGFLIYLVNRFILRTGSMLQGGNFVVRRSALEAIGGFDPRFHFYGEDTDIARRLNKQGRVVFTFGLKVKTSGRRLKAEGLWRVGARYAANYFSTIFLKKAVTETASAVRLNDK
jgi:glycosyltransferase involved in cell wall biosynthesis